MSRISNLTTIKIGLLRSWNSYWFDSYYYSYLLLGDLRIRDYITGIFYNLNIITDYLHIYRFVADNLIIKTNLIFLDYVGYKSIYVDGLYKLDEDFKFFYNKRTWEIFLTNLKIIGGITDNKNHYDINDSYNVFLNYCKLYYLFSHFLDSRINQLLGTYTALPNICIENNNHDVLELDSLNLMVNNRYLDILVSGPMNFKFRANHTISNFINQFYNFGSYYSVIYYILSHKHYIDYSSSIHVPRDRVPNYKLVQLINYLGNLNYFLSFLIINFLIILKYIMIISNHYMNINLEGLNNLISKILSSNFIIDNIYVREFEWNELYIYNIRENITKSVINSLRFKIEKSIYSFENKNIYFYFSLFIKRIPFIISAKVITDFLVYMFESGNGIVKSFYYIRNLQRRFHRQRRKLEYLFHSKKTEFQDKNKYTREQAVSAINFYKYVHQLAMKRFPLIGMRIECNGSFKKGKMARTYHYTNWNRDYMLTGSMPNNTLISDIDYYQYYTILNSSSIGIKTWIFLETYLYNSNNMYIGIIY